ncbi:MAG: hypothetical protein ACQCXQ_06845 [Verrucomicrobiales bacterium]
MISAGRFQIDHNQGIRLEDYQGSVGLSDLRAVASAMASDERWSPSYHGLIDLSKADLELTANEVLRMALTLRQDQHRSTGWMVYVVKNSAAYGQIRMLAYWARNTERTRIFLTRKEAEAWLERNADKNPPSFPEQAAANEAKTQQMLRDAV